MLENRKSKISAFRPFETYSNIPVPLLDQIIYEFYVNMQSYDSTIGSDFEAAEALIQMIKSKHTAKKKDNKALNLKQWVQKYLTHSSSTSLHSSSSSSYPKKDKDDLEVIKHRDGSTPMAVLIYSETLGVDEQVKCGKKYLNLCRDFLDSVKSSRFPIITIQISSVQIRVCGAVFGETISIEALGCFDIWPSNESSVHSKTAQVIGALRQAQERTLKLDDKQLEFPWFRSYDESGQHFQIDYISRVKSGMFTHVFEATSHSTPESPLYGSVGIVVKFTKQYCSEAHQICANLNLAPKLLHFEKVKILIPPC